MGRKSSLARGYSRDRRVRRRAEFDLVLRSRRRLSGSFVVMAVHGPTQQSFSRLGLAVSRRVGGAVLRNRVKRLLREDFRQCDVIQRVGVDLVVQVRGRVTRSREGLMRQEFVNLLARAAEKAARGA